MATNNYNKTAAEDMHQAAEALAYIPADLPRDEWVQAAMALKSGFGDGAFKVFDEWSQGGSSYNAADAKSTWRSISQNGGITVASLYSMAKEYGYRPVNGEAPSASTFGKSKPKQAKQASQGEEREQPAKETAKQTESALAEWNSAKPADDSHPYLVRKNVKSHGLRIDTKGNLLVPAYRGDQFASFQRIPAEKDAKKPIATGTEIKGCTFTINQEQHPTRIYIGEGYATAATVAELTGAMAVVSFGSGNLMAVGQVVRKQHPYAEIVFLADDDFSSEPNTGVVKSKAAAVVVDGLVAIPEFGEHRSNADTDFNDLRMLMGGNAVLECLRKAFDPDEDLLPVHTYNPGRMLPVEYVIDGFLATGITLIAGSPGVGKTTAMVTMAAVAAGLVKYANGITATLRRKVYYVTEDPQQVERILYGLKKHGMIEAPDDVITGMFTIINARRRSHDEVGKMVLKARRRGTCKAPSHQNFYSVEPLIVLDTSNATIDMDDENNNSEAGKAIACIKESLGNGALWLAGHTAKGLKRAGLGELSFRGAGAFEGDCRAVTYIFQEDEKDKNTRFWALGKRRFEADFNEVKIDSEADYEIVGTPWGDDQKCWYRIGTLSKSSDAERIQAKEERADAAKAEKEKVDGLALRGNITAYLLKAAKENKQVNVTMIKQNVSGNGARISKQLEAMEESGLIIVTEMSKAKYVKLNTSEAHQ